MEYFDSKTDEQLALLYVNGNNQAFDVLLARIQSKVFSYIMYVVKDYEVANDIFQDTFVKVITRLQEGKYTDNGRFLYWVTKIAHNVIMDYFRQQRVDNIVDIEVDNDLNAAFSDTTIEASRENEIVNSQVLEDVKRMMDRLTPMQREVVHMRIFQNLSFKDIADITNVSINTSLGRMRYAIHNLRKMAKDYDIELKLEMN